LFFNRSAVASKKLGPSAVRLGGGPLSPRNCAAVRRDWPETARRIHDVSELREDREVGAQREDCNMKVADVTTRDGRITRPCATVQKGLKDEIETKARDG